MIDTAEVMACINTSANGKATDENFTLCTMRTFDYLKLPLGQFS